VQARKYQGKRDDSLGLYSMMIAIILDFEVLYSTLLHLPPHRFRAEAGIEPGIVPTFEQAVIRSNHSDRSISEKMIIIHIKFRISKFLGNTTLPTFDKSKYPMAGVLLRASIQITHCTPLTKEQNLQLFDIRAKYLSCKQKHSHYKY
jgi:hypothetical protein